MVKSLNLQDQIQKVGANNLLTWLKLEVGGKTISENLVLLALPKELKLSDPKLATTVEDSGDGFVVTIKSEKPALWTVYGWNWKTRTQKISDNFIHVPLDSPQIIFSSTGSAPGQR